ncbi:hypothetical protein [Blastococcus sp. SYSU DS1024]
MIGIDHFDQLLATTRPVGSEQPVKIDWPGYSQGLREAGVDPNDVVTLSWARFSERNPEALTESTALVALHPMGIFESVGKRKMFGGGLKYRTIDFSMVRGFEADEVLIEHHGILKYNIDFVGAGGILLGRLEWHMQGRRFKERANKMAAMETASERDRFLAAVEKVLE